MLLLYSEFSLKVAYGQALFYLLIFKVYHLIRSIRGITTNLTIVNSCSKKVHQERDTVIASSHNLQWRIPDFVIMVEGAAFRGAIRGGGPLIALEPINQTRYFYS